MKIYFIRMLIQANYFIKSSKVTKSFLLFVECIFLVFNSGNPKIIFLLSTSYLRYFIVESEYSLSAVRFFLEFRGSLNLNIFS